ncbi:MAG: hypothetical protein ACLTLQ_06310 [[Clostridium] scindens]
MGQRTGDGPVSIDMEPDGAKWGQKWMGITGINRISATVIWNGSM